MNEIRKLGVCSATDLANKVNELVTTVNNIPETDAQLDSNSTNPIQNKVVTTELQLKATKINAQLSGDSTYSKTPNLGDRSKLISNTEFVQKELDDLKNKSFTTQYVGGNLVQFGSLDDSYIVDSGKKVSDFALGTNKIVAGEGLVGQGQLSNIATTLSHQSKPTVGQSVESGTLGVISDVSIDKFGHIVSVSKTEQIRNAEKLKTAVNIEGFNFDGSHNIKCYFVCNSAESDVEKVISFENLDIDSYSPYSLAPGSRVFIKFTNTNTAQNVKLKIDNTASKPIYYKNLPIPNNYLIAGYIYCFVYDGTNYILQGSNVQEAIDLCKQNYENIATVLQTKINTAIIPNGNLITVYENTVTDVGINKSSVVTTNTEQYITSSKYIGDTNTYTKYTSSEIQVVQDTGYAQLNANSLIINDLDNETTYGINKIAVIDGGTQYNLNLPKKSGTIAILSDIPNVSDTVRYSTQTLTEAQKLQVRTNIGVPTKEQVLQGGIDIAQNNNSIIVPQFSKGLATNTPIQPITEGTLQINGDTAFNIKGRGEIGNKTVYAPTTIGQSGKFVKSNGTQATWSNITGTDITGLLDSDGKINVSLIPDAVLGQLTFGGLISVTGEVTCSSQFKTIYGISTDTLTLTGTQTEAQRFNGAYFIVQGITQLTDITIMGVEDVSTGDWIVAVGTPNKPWRKVDNTDSITLPDLGRILSTPSATATMLSEGSSPTASVEATVNEAGKQVSYDFTFGIPKGKTGASAGFATQMDVITTTSEPGTEATVAVTPDNTTPNTAKKFNFEFTIPRGQDGTSAGFGQPTVTITTLDAGRSATASVSTSGPNIQKVFAFTFGIPKGDAGTRGSIWYYGTVLAHTTSTGTLSDNVEHIVGDMYLNTETGYTYRCVVSGTNVINAWEYIYGSVYSAVLSTSSWLVNAKKGGYYYYISATTHKRGLNPTVLTYIKDYVPSTISSSTQQTWVQAYDSPYVDDNGNVYLVVDTPIELKVVIK